MTSIIELDALTLDGGTQVRAGLDEKTVAAYAEHMADGVVFPPILVYLDEQGTYYLADGFRRVAAARRAGRDRLPALVYAGDRDAALWCALGANRAFDGLSAPEKEHAVTMAVAVWPKKTQQEIARHVGCAQSLVSRVLSRLTKMARGARLIRNITGDNSGPADAADVGQLIATADLQQDAVRKAIAAGHPSAHIRQALHVHSSTVTEVRKAMPAGEAPAWTTGKDGRRYAASHTLRKRNMETALAMIREGRTIADVVAADLVSKGNVHRLWLKVHGRRDGRASSPPVVQQSAIQLRRGRMQQLATQGYTSRQIAEALGLTPSGCRSAARRAGIAIPADRIVGHRRIHDPNRIVERIALDASDLGEGIDLIDFHSLDRAKIPEWIKSLKDAREHLQSLVHRLSKELQHVEVA